MTRQMATISTMALAFALGACSGGGSSGGGGSVVSTPIPITSPAPAPTPTPTPTSPPLPAGAAGLVDGPFTTFSVATTGWGDLDSGADAVKIAYSATDGRYTVTIPGYEKGELTPTSGNGSYNGGDWVNLQSISHSLALGTGPGNQNLTVTLDRSASTPFHYTSFGSWSGSLPMGEARGYFAYGRSTATGDVPKTGSATYSGLIRGLTDGIAPNGNTGYNLDVFGQVKMSFDFAGGVLSGTMHPEIASIWDSVSLGTYTFRDTNYASGATAFSGAFEVPGSSAPSSFSGIFAGPAGAELMAQWRAPFKHPETGAWGTMSGAWIAKKN